MSREIRREEVSAAVLAVIQGWHFDLSIDERTRFDFDLPLDNKVKSLYFYAIRLKLENLGYCFADFCPEDCENARSIGDIVEAVWDDVNPRSNRVM